MVSLEMWLEMWLFPYEKDRADFRTRKILPGKKCNLKVMFQGNAS